MSMRLGLIGAGLTLVLAALTLGGCETAHRSRHSRETVIVPRRDDHPREVRVRHVYRYYPEVDVYHDEERGGYWYMRNREWEFGVELPSSIRVSGEHVTVEVESDKPYTEHEKHRKAYGPKRDNRREKENEKEEKRSNNRRQ